MYDSSSRGVSLLEFLTATLLSMVLLAAAAALFKPAMDVGYLMTQQAAMNRSARLAINVIALELGQAGNGIPGGGVQLPSGTGSIATKFACDSSTCYISSNTYTDQRLHALLPGDGKGLTVNGIVTDVVTSAYRDPNSNLDQLALLEVSATGNQIKFDTNTSPAYNDPDTGVQVGDILLVCNTNGCAAGAVTNVSTGGYVDLGDDPLEINQPNAAFGNVKSIMTPAAESRAFRILVVTYYVDDTNEDALRLMRQVNAQSPRVAAFNIENLQMSYDIFDEDSSSTTNNLADAGGTPNQIRQMNVSISARSPVEGMFERGYERMVLTTSVSARNLRLRDSY